MNFVKLQKTKKIKDPKVIRFEEPMFKIIKNKFCYHIMKSFTPMVSLLPPLRIRKLFYETISQPICK